VDSALSAINIPINSVAYEAEPAWLTNAAGYKFHNYYGFGRINIGAAVTAAKAYTAGGLGTFVTGSWVASGSLNTAIPDNSATGISKSLTVSDSRIIEAVQLKVKVSHTYTGDLSIELTSPSGTKSVLFTPYNGFAGSDNLTEMVLLSNAFYGESSAGNWTIKVVDAMNSYNGSLASWNIRIFGH
jgi:hypothetical protein